MNLLNIHEHPIVIYIYQNNNFVKEEVLLKGELSEISCNDLYCIICEKCNDLYNDLLALKENPEIFKEKKGFFSKLFGFK